MKNIFKSLANQLFLRKLYFIITSSIAFYPSLIAFLILIGSYICMLLDEHGLSYDFYKFLPFLLTHNPDTARSLLSSLAAGLISLMVFSFTMVMVVLSQASSNYTPRVLPGLISQKSHQVVLGIYLGSIGFTITVLTNIEGKRYDFVVPELALAVNAILGFISFIAFVYFIHSISQKIQLGHILTNLHDSTFKLLIDEQKQHYVKYINDETQGWNVFHSPVAGYFHSLNSNMLISICKKHNLKMLFLAEKGAFMLESTPLFKVDKVISNEVDHEIRNTIIYRHQEDLQVNYLYGFKQITEMALRALSPGINDPATAIQAIDYLSHLFVEQNKIKGYKVYKDDLDNDRIYFHETSFSKIYYLSMGSVRNYAETDITVQLKLIQTIDRLLEVVEEESARETLILEKEAIHQISQQSFKAQIDRDRITAAVSM